MEDMLKQDVFFFITSIAVIILTALLVAVFVYAIKILNDVKYIAKKAKSETDLLAEDLRELRENVKTEGSKLKSFSKFFSSVYKRSKR